MCFWDNRLNYSLSRMSQVLDAWLIFRDPPAFREVEQLANVYLESKEFASFNHLLLERVHCPSGEAIRIHCNTLLYWTRSQLLASMEPQLLNPPFMKTHPHSWSCVVLESKTPYPSVLAESWNVHSLTSDEQITGIYSSWHRALYDAIHQEILSAKG